MLFPGFNVKIGCVNLLILIAENHKIDIHSLWIKVSI
jgi:hypothetical protein